MRTDRRTDGQTPRQTDRQTPGRNLYVSPWGKHNYQEIIKDISLIKHESIENQDYRIEFLTNLLQFRVCVHGT